MSETPKLTPEEVAGRQAAIELYLSKCILRDNILPTDPRSFFRMNPAEYDAEDAELIEMHERSQGDPVLYAIYFSVENARARLEEAHRDGSTDDVVQARDELADARELEQYYLHPEDSPFEPVKPIDL